MQSTRLIFEKKSKFDTAFETRLIFEKKSKFDTAFEGKAVENLYFCSQINRNLAI